MVGPKCKIFGQDTIYFLQGMSLHQNLGMILENKVVQKLNLEKNDFTNIGLLDYYSLKFHNRPDIIGQG